MTERLGVLTTKFTHVVKNSRDVKQQINSFVNANTLFLASFDVKDMYPSIPHELVFTSARQMLGKLHWSQLEIEEMLTLLKSILECNYFQFENNFIQQKDGLAMGNPVSPILANLVLHVIESNILDNQQFRYIRFMRYVDDCLVIYKERATLDTLFDVFNSYHRNIKFTLELEKDDVLNFLDLKIKRHNNKFVTEVFHKENSGDIYINKNSFQPWAHKINTWKNFYRRAIELSDLQVDREREVQFITELGIKNGYSKKQMESWYKEVLFKINKKHSQSRKEVEVRFHGKIPYFPPCSTRIKRIFAELNVHLAESPPCNWEKMISQFKTYFVDHTQKSGVYLLECECSGQYVGVTKRNLATRIKEHIRDARRSESNCSGISQHMRESGHTIQETRILVGANSQVERNIREAFQIIKRNPELNLDAGNLNTLWQRCFERFMNRYEK